VQTVTKESLVACEECGLIVGMPPIREGHTSECPRCHYTLSSIAKQPFQTTIAYAVACLIMLVLSVSFPFMSFSVKGLTQEIGLLNTVAMLDEFRYSMLATLFLLTVVVLPAIYIGFILYLYSYAAIRSPIKSNQAKRYIQSMCKAIFVIEPWLMVEVFLIGVLVSLIKIAALADIGMGYSFWAFCIYTVLVVKCISSVDRYWLWNQLTTECVVEGVQAGDDHLSANHVSCHTCSQINQVSEKKCIRCGSKLHHYDPGKNLQKAWAFLLSAVIFYLPANLYPIMYTVSLGSESPSTIIGGVVLLWHHGSYPIAGVIFIASVFIPLAKMLTLAWMFIVARRVNNAPLVLSLKRQKLYRLTEFIGRWSMIDIFVVAILVTLVQLHSLMAIYPGPASLSFAAVVIFTMLSAMVFDSRALWSGVGCRMKNVKEMADE
jgi:paraquat-inducible protein A